MKYGTLEGTSILVNSVEERGEADQPAGHDVVVIGASAGGVDALVTLVKILPKNLPAAVFIVVHIPDTATSYLPAILSRSGLLPALHPVDGEEIKPGQIYIAPPNWHLLLSTGHITLSPGPKEHGHRPAIDTLFQSAALNYGPRVVGVILSGTQGDGAVGLAEIKNRGGVAVVQDPEEAVFASMPLNAMGKVQVDHVLDIAGIGKLVKKLAAAPAVQKGVVGMEKKPEKERRQISQDFERFKQGEKPEHSSILSCPDCGGVVFEMGEGDQPHFRCHIGHTYSLESYVGRQSDGLERALWTAVRILQERSALLERMALASKQRGSVRSADYFYQQAQEINHQKDVIRQALEALPTSAEDFYVTDSTDFQSLDIQNVDVEGDATQDD
jgi:two-component system, chemotaxis family, protein-glutamate methylesterase/glutaminase